MGAIKISLKRGCHDASLNLEADRFLLNRMRKIINSSINANAHGPCLSYGTAFIKYNHGSGSESRSATLILFDEGFAIT